MTNVQDNTQVLRCSVEVLIRHPTQLEKFLTVTNRRWGGFSCPGGKAERGERLVDAARRELLEETGCMALSMQPLIGGVHYEEPKDGGPSWFCMSYTADIGDQAPTQQEEGTEIGWHTEEELIKESIYPDWYAYLFARIKHLGV